MATLIQAQVIIQATSNITADNSTNTWHFYSPLPFDPDDNVNIVDMIKDFYSKSYDTGATVGSFLSPQVQPNADVKLYNMGDPTPRVPIFESSFSLSRPGSGTPLPQEVALVFSYQAQRQSGMSQARRRNRIYLGPLAQTALGTNGRPSEQIINAMARAGRELKKASDASLSWQWRVYSPTVGESFLVHDGWIDNSFDTQRRRGVDPTARTLWDEETP